MTDIYVTKYALTAGIKKYPLDHQDGQYVWVKVPTALSGRMMFCAGEWHWDQADAIARAEAMRVAKITSLKKQIARLEKLMFEVKP